MLGEYLGQMLVVIVGVLATTFGLKLVIQTIFAELSKYHKKQLEPFEGSLNKLFSNCSEALSTMLNMACAATAENMTTKEDEKEIDYEFDLKE